MEWKNGIEAQVTHMHMHVSDQDGMDEWEFAVFDEANPSEEIAFAHHVTLNDVGLFMHAAATMWPDKQLRMVVMQVR